MDERFLEALRELDSQKLDRRSFLRGVAAIAASAGVAMVSHGCAPAPTPTPAAPPTPADTPTPVAPKIGGQLDVCVWEGYDDPAVAKPFTDEYGVTVGGTYIASNEECFTKEKTAPGIFDAIGINLTYCESFYKGGLILPVDLEIVTTWPDSIENLREQPYINFEGKPWLVPSIWGTECVIYNPEFVELPEVFSLKDLMFDDRYKGRLIVNDDPLGMILTFGIESGFPDPVSRITKEQLQQVIDLGIRMKERLLTIAPSFSDATELMVRGDAWIQLKGWEAMIRWAMDSGVTLKNAFAKRSYSWCDGWMVTSNSDNIETAWAYIDQMTGPEAMALLAANMYCAPANSKSYPLLKDEVAEMFRLEKLEPALANSPIQPLFPDESDEYITLAEAMEAWEIIKTS